MPVTLEHLRDLKARKLDLEIANEELQIEFGKIKLAQAERDWRADQTSQHERRVLTYAGPIRRELTTQAIRQLDAWSAQDPGCEMTILLNSEGGDTISGFGLYDFLTELKRRGHKITIKVIGGCMSMAVPVLQAADDRVISPHSWILLHEGKFTFDEAVSMGANDLEQYRSIMKKYEKQIVNILAKRSNMTASQIEKKWKNKEWMIDAEEAVRLGLVDRIED